MAGQRDGQEAQAGARLALGEGDTGLRLALLGRGGADGVDQSGQGTARAANDKGRWRVNEGQGGRPRRTGGSR